MANSKYISKVRIGNEDFTIRDKEAYRADNIPVNGVTDDITFKDQNGKMFKLSLVDKKVKLVKVTYNAPTISISNFTWNGSDNLSWNVDQPSKNMEEKAVSGTINVANGTKPTCSVDTITISGTSSPYTIGGTATIANNGSLEFKFTTTGTMPDPSTGKTAKPSVSKTVSRTTTVTSAYMVNSSATSPQTYTSGGFRFNVGGTPLTPTAKEFGNNQTATLDFVKKLVYFSVETERDDEDPNDITYNSTRGYIYIFTDSAKSFVMSTDKATVDSAKLGGGVMDPTTVKTYSIQKQYYVYRSLRPFAANTDVYVKAIV